MVSSSLTPHIFSTPNSEDCSAFQLIPLFCRTPVKIILLETLSVILFSNGLLSFICLFIHCSAGLVRLLKPGCRTVVLLVDAESKPKLLPQFFKAVFPYRKNKTLMFAFMMLEKNLEWYRRLLLQTLGESSHRPLNINPKNCIGTVSGIVVGALHRFTECIYTL